MEDDDCFEVALDVSSYKPEELQVVYTLYNRGAMSNV